MFYKSNMEESISMVGEEKASTNFDLTPLSLVSLVDAGL
jgi:hypothetical protein